MAEQKLTSVTDVTRQIGTVVHCGQRLTAEVTMLMYNCDVCRKSFSYMNLRNYVFIVELDGDFLDNCLAILINAHAMPWNSGVNGIELSETLEILRDLHKENDGRHTA